MIYIFHSHTRKKSTTISVLSTTIFDSWVLIIPSFYQDVLENSKGTNF